MRTPGEIGERILAALQVDLAFTEYEVEFSPDETTVFILHSPSGEESRGAILTWLQKTNALIPQRRNERRARTGHRYRVGRKQGQRIICLRVPMAAFPRQYRFSAFLHALESYAKEAGAMLQVQSDHDDFSILFWWTN